MALWVSKFTIKPSVTFTAEVLSSLYELVRVTFPCLLPLSAEQNSCKRKLVTVVTFS